MKYQITVDKYELNHLVDAIKDQLKKARTLSRFLSFW